MWTLVPSFAGTQQQDAHEFTRFLLERLRLEFVKGDAVVKANERLIQSGEKRNSSSQGRHQPRGREHDPSVVLMGELGIPNPIRRSRSLRQGPKNGGKWTDSPGSQTPSNYGDNGSGEISPGADGGWTPRGAVSPTAIAAGLTAAAMKGGKSSDKKKKTQETTVTGDDEEEPGGFMIVSRWGAVQHKLGCPCRPCKSRRKAEGGDPDDPFRFPGEPVNVAMGFPGEPVSKSRADALAAAHKVKSPNAPESPGRGGKKQNNFTPVVKDEQKFETVKPVAVTPVRTRVANVKAEKAIEIDLETPGGSLDCLPDGLDKDGLPTDPVWRMFGGMALSRICCTRCGHASTRREPFLDISLPIPPVVGSTSPGAGSPPSPRVTPGGSKEPLEKGNGPNGCVTLQQCLAAHTRDETLAGPGRFYCERCGDVGGATKQNKLQTLPPVLCLHLKRFTWRGTGARSKLNVHVDFPLDSLDLGLYMESDEGNEGGRGAGPTGRAAAETAAAAAVAAAEMADLTKEMAAESGSAMKRPRRTSTSSLVGDAAAASAKATAAQEAAQQAQKAAAMAMANWIDQGDGLNSGSNSMYDLSAAVVHHGTGIGSGHYTVFARRGGGEGGELIDHKKKGNTLQSTQWAQFNDDKVLDATEEDVKQSGGYLFFYTRQEEKSKSNAKGWKKNERKR